MTRWTDCVCVVVCWSWLGLAAATPGCDTPERAAVQPTAAAQQVEAPPPDPGRITRLLEVRAPLSPTLAPDGGVYFIDSPDGVRQLFWRPPGGLPEGPATALTAFPDGVSGYGLRPDGQVLLVWAAVGGSELDDIYLLERPGGAPRPLLANPAVMYTFRGWLPDGSGFLYSANERDPARFDLHRYTLASGTSTRVLTAEEPGYWEVADIHDDGTRALVAHSVSASDARSYELDLRTGQRTPLQVGEGPARTTPVGYLPGHGQALLLSDAEGGLKGLWALDLGTGAASRPLPELAAHEVEAAFIDEDRRVLALRQNLDGYGRARVFTLPDLSEAALPVEARGVVSVVQVRGDTVVWTVEGPRDPGAAWVWTLGGAEAPRPLTTQVAEGVDLAALVEPELVRYPSFDGLEVPALLFLPPGRAAGQPVPFIVWFHGGPEGQARPMFNAQAQVYLDQGFGILMPNVRGSTGYGRAYHQLDDHERRWDSVRDGVAGARWLVAQGYAEAGRIAAYGGSYGGFMSLACAIEGGALFGAAVDIVGIVNFQSFLEQTSSYRRALREVEYGPLDDLDFLRSISPITRVDELRVPVLIAHGLNDPRVPIAEAMQLAEALQRRGEDPELLFFADEGHSLRKLDNRELFTLRAVRFLRRHLVGPAAGPTPRG